MSERSRTRSSHGSTGRSRRSSGRTSYGRSSGSNSRSSGSSPRSGALSDFSNYRDNEFHHHHHHAHHHRNEDYWDHHHLPYHYHHRWKDRYYIVQPPPPKPKDPTKEIHKLLLEQNQYLTLLQKQTDVANQLQMQNLQTQVLQQSTAHQMEMNHLTSQLQHNQLTNQMFALATKCDNSPKILNIPGPACPNPGPNTVVQMETSSSDRRLGPDSDIVTDHREWNLWPRRRRRAVGCCLIQRR